MFGYLFYPQLVMEVGKDYFSQFEPINNCPLSCNSRYYSLMARGFCKDKKCYCKHGYVGTSCAFSYSEYQNTAEAKLLQSKESLHQRENLSFGDLYRLA